MNNLLQRSLTGFVYVSIFVSAILYSKESFLLLTTIFALISLFEFNKIIQFKNIVPYFLLPLVGYYFIFHLNNNQTFLFLILTLFTSIKLIYQLYTKVLSSPKIFLNKINLCIRYIILPFVFLMMIPFTDGSYNPQILIGILILIWVNDSFAFLVGKNFGKRKLFESISPKKTIEGFVGGAIFSFISSYIIAINTATFSALNWFIISIIVSIIGTIGDLVESKFKRQANIKDSGNIMPGHGGLLDRLDSLFFVSPFIYLYIHFIL